MLPRLGSCALVILASVVSGAEIPKVTIISPQKDQPSFGNTVVSAMIEGGEPVVRVTFFVDGRKVGEALTPPYQITVDLGQDNVSHTFRAVARSSSGTVGQGEIVTPKIQIDETVSFDLQQLYVTVTKNDARVLDLRREDFEIFDNGVKQKPITFERGSIPFTAMILLDASTSMVGKKIRSALNGAQAFASGMQPLDEAKLLVFSASLLGATPFVGPGEGLTKGLETINAQGGTSLNDHLYVALKQLEERQGRRVVIVLSDGMDSHSVLSIDDTMPIIERSRALIYWVKIEEGGKKTLYRDPSMQFSSWRDGRGYRRQIDLLESSALGSGGRITPIDSPDAVAPEFTEILQELRDQYVFGYYPSNTSHNGRWHDVEVRIRRSGYRVRAARGYFDF